jgi:LCP family protein required for cell wall assembly
MAKINASFAFGGPPLLVRTVEDLTGVRVEHFAVIDFAGFQALTDSVGGIDVNVAAPTTFGTLTLHAGRNHLDGAQALGYVRQRTGLPRGDLDRVQRHQNALRALLTKVAAGGLLADPARTLGFLDELSRWVTVDDGLTNGGLRTLGWDMRNLRPGGITFLTVPVADLGREGKQSVAHLDSARAAQLWQHLADGNISAYLRRYPGTELGDTPS